MPNTYNIPYCLHIPVKNPDGSTADACTDPDGAAQDGNMRPVFDTLIGIANPYEHVVTVRFAFFGQQGQPLAWSDGATNRDYELEGGHSMATTLIPGNVFGPVWNTPVPPQDFIGYGKLETWAGNPFSPKPSGIPVWAMLGGGGCVPQHWNTFSAQVPVYRGPILQKSTWLFPYTIPFYEDGNHAGNQSYRTGIVVTSWQPDDVWLHFTYTVGNHYAGVGDSFTWKRHLPGNSQIVEDLYNWLTAAGYDDYQNSEGWLNIQASTDPNNDNPTTAALSAYALISQAGYDNFAAGQGAW